jgi:hypothetical protein
MTMTNDFESALWKIDRARKHANELEAEISAFAETVPYGGEIVGTPESGHGQYRVSRVSPLPVSFSLIAGDAAHNIRSALDHFAWAAVPPQSHHPRTMFPVWNRKGSVSPTRDQGRDKWRDEVESALKGAAAQLIEAVVKLEPWQGGRDSLLWAVNELERVDKHRLLLSVAAANTAISIDFTRPEEKAGPVLRLRPDSWTPLETGKVLLDVGLYSGFATPPKFDIDVMLQEPQELRDKPVVTQLRILAGYAEKTIQELMPLSSGHP